MKKAFTLVELLIVIAILAVLAVVVFVVINPAQRIAEANNTQVRNNVEAIHKAFELYAIDNEGNYPPQDPPWGGAPIPTYPEPPKSDNCRTDAAGNLNGAILVAQADGLLSDGTYLPSNIDFDGPFEGTFDRYRAYIYSPTGQILICGWLADGSTYYYPQIAQ